MLGAPHHNSADVLVIGAGVIGLATAIELLQAGRSVLVVDAGRIGGGSSHGNCGTITPSHAAPLAEPGKVARALRWLLTPDAPFYVRPRFDPALWGWFARFASRCNARDWREAMRDKAALLQASRALLQERVERYALDCEFLASGTDYVFRDERALERFAAELDALSELGIDSGRIDGDAYLREETSLLPGVVGAVRFPGDARLRPDRFAAELARFCKSLGGEIIENCAVDAVEFEDDGVRMHAGGQTFAANDVVLAAGSWSPSLARDFGLRIPIQPGKGYSITYDRPAKVPRRPLVLFERSVCVTAWDSGFRLGSTMEFSGYDASLNRRRLDALERGAAEYLHEPVGPAKREEWFGWRPMTWDDLPLIGPVPGKRGAWIATGHGMLGVSMSMATAVLLGDLMLAREAIVDPHPYRPERFG
ncbi:MAG TPA: FAD-dependent oxidoreductase [Lysobacter sp.]|nr:FAD-dependent oxidoreductase [Lysobacter sp.]